MSGKDYAKLQANTRARQKHGNSAGTVLAIFLIAGLCFATGFWIGSGSSTQPKDMVSRSNLQDLQTQLDVKLAEAKVQQAKIETLQELVAEWKAKAEQDAHSKVGDLNFYQELPEQNVQPAPVEPSSPAGAADSDNRYTPPEPPKDAPPETLTPHATIDTSAPSGGYRIQLGSFRDSHDAARVQQKLVHAGFPAMIRQVDLGEKGTWYRVYGGPYADKGKAETASRKIAGKLKIQGLILRDN